MDATFAIVELLGRQVIAGRVSEELIAGLPMLRVDVPAAGAEPAYTKFFGGPAVYAITPTDEAMMLRAVARLHVAPVAPYILAPERQLAAPLGEPPAEPPFWLSDDCAQCELLEQGWCPPKLGAGPCPFEYAEVEEDTGG